MQLELTKLKKHSAVDHVTYLPIVGTQMSKAPYFKGHVRKSIRYQVRCFTFLFIKRDRKIIFWPVSRES